MGSFAYLGGRISGCPGLSFGLEILLMEQLRLTPTIRRSALSGGWTSALNLSGLAIVAMALIVPGDAVGAEINPKSKSTDISPWTTTHGGRSSSKQASPRGFNPKEFKLDQKSTGKKAPKAITTCLTPDGKRRRRC